ncbi:hypothetical protein [uncultured Ruminococcus sp.]|uniref:hypothetical protein n=1 Tax=uncultured Ruminococcus sp. TaxID=165186 RepID=UPI00262A8013|nr:hypothetical protein [uncultured Ruminococcus sp.]
MNQGGTTVNYRPLCLNTGFRGVFCYIASGGDRVSNIMYNQQEEAYELPYKLWDEMMTVRFYTESEETIISNLSDIAKKLVRLDGGRDNIAAMLIDDGFYEGGNAQALAKLLKLRNVYVDIDEEETVVCFETGTDDGYMENYVHVELFGELFEITGWAD